MGRLNKTKTLLTTEFNIIIFSVFIYLDSSELILFYINLWLSMLILNILFYSSSFLKKMSENFNMKIMLFKCFVLFQYFCQSHFRICFLLTLN